MATSRRRRVVRAAAVSGLVSGCLLALGSHVHPAPAGGRALCPGPDVEQEPNDTPASATPITVWLSASHGYGGGISVPGDVDYYRIELQAGDRLWAAVDTGRSSATAPYSRDSVLEVHAPGGVALLERDDDDGTANGRDTTIESQEASIIAGFTATAGGAYLLRVSAKSPTALIAPYTLFVGVSRGSVPEQEPNDTPETAMIGSFGVVDAALSGPTDVDYYRLWLLDAGLPFVAVDGDPERDGIGTDVVVEWVTNGPTPSLQMQADSSGAGGSPAPPAEGALLESAGTQQTVRIKGPAAGTYRVGVLWSGYCSVPVLLEKIEIE